MVVCRRAFNLNEIATWFDRLTMSGCAPRNDRWGWALSAMTVGQFGLTKWVRVRIFGAAAGSNAGVER